MFDSLTTAAARSIEMIFPTLFSCTARVFSVTCKLLNGSFVLGGRSLYLSAFLSVCNVTSGGRSTYIKFPISNLGKDLSFRTKYVLYRSWSRRNVPDSLGANVTSWTKRRTLKTFVIFADKVTVGRTVRLSIVTEPRGCRVYVRENRDTLVERCGGSL